jgi:hypothetical protein
MGRAVEGAWTDRLSANLDWWVVVLWQYGITDRYRERSLSRCGSTGVIIEGVYITCFWRHLLSSMTTRRVTSCRPQVGFPEKLLETHRGLGSDYSLLWHRSGFPVSNGKETLMCSRADISRGDWQDWRLMKSLPPERS